MNDQLPTEIRADNRFGLPITGLAPGLALFFNDELFNRCIEIAKIMAQSKGIAPPHLIGQQEACFAVVSMAITWRLAPFNVAQSTYQTPGGKIGYEGKLVQAILENSGQLVGPVKYELIGDWSVLRGKFRKEKSQKPGSDREYFVPAWDPNKDEEGLGVRVSAQVKGEVDRRVEEFWLRSFWPRNSTLWATRPEQQIKYAAARAFANTAMPGIFMGVPFTDDEDSMRDITPAQPERGDFIETTVEWDKAGQPPTDVTELTPEQATTAQAEPEPAPEFSHADAHAMGVEHRDKQKPMSVPPDLGPDFHDAFLDGWRSRDDELRAQAKGGKR